jgi:hypothetical protein
VSDSRRGVLALHAHDRARMARCPICRWAIEQDHSEALAMHAAGTWKKTLPASPQAPRPTAQPEAAAVLGFALV